MRLSTGPPRVNNTIHRHLGEKHAIAVRTTDDAESRESSRSLKRQMSPESERTNHRIGNMVMIGDAYAPVRVVLLVGPEQFISLRVRESLKSSEFTATHAEQTICRTSMNTGGNEH